MPPSPPLCCSRAGIAGLLLALVIGPGAARAGLDVAPPPPFLDLESTPGGAADPGWRRDRGLEERLRLAVRDLGLAGLAASGDFGVALVDVTDPRRPRLAEVNGNHMMYAASVPKIGVLYAAFQAARAGRLRIDEPFRRTLTDMIRVSSNTAASEAIARLGFNYINSVLWQSGLYDPAWGGGLWVGKAYGGPSDYWHRDPLFGQSHGATPVAVAKLLTLLAQERLVDAEASCEMKEILGDPGLHHKFVRGLDARPGARIYRKSGTWRDWHGDAALVERDDRRYVATALLHDENGGEILERLIVALDDIVGARD